MAMKYMRMIWLMGERRIWLDCINTHNQYTWCRSVTACSSLKFNQHQYSYRKKRSPCYHYLSGVSLGFLGIFNFNEEKKQDPEEELIMMIKRSIWLIQKEQFEKAEQMLHLALNQAQLMQHEDGITYIFDVLANLAFERNENKKAKALFTTIMQRLLSTGTPQDDKRIIHMSIKMAKISERMGDPETAEDGYKYCLKHAETHMNNDPDDEDATVLYAMTLDWYGALLVSRARYKEALKNYLQAYDLCLKIYGKNHEQTIVILNDLGTVSCMLTEYDRALDYLNEAIEIGIELPEKDHLSTIYINLGKVYIKKKLLDQAKIACSEALKLAKENDNNEGENLAKRCLKEVQNII